MSDHDEHKLIALRREKLATLRQQGSAYPNDFRRDAWAGELHAQYDGHDKQSMEEKAVRVKVAGRMMAKRVMGKASFAKLVDGSGDIPLIPKEMDDSALAMGRVQIDDKTALCPASGAKLRLFALAGEQRQHVHDTLLEMARIRYQEFTKKKKNKEEGEDYGFEELSNFSSWLE